jgi:hypothetical protein
MLFREENTNPAVRMQPIPYACTVPPLKMTETAIGFVVQSNAASKMKSIPNRI